VKLSKSIGSKTQAYGTNINRKRKIYIIKMENNLKNCYCGMVLEI